MTKTSDELSLMREDAADNLWHALRLLYDETADYIRLNHLGDVHHNVSMQNAFAALQEYKPKQPERSEQVDHTLDEQYSRVLDLEKKLQDAAYVAKLTDGVLLSTTPPEKERVQGAGEFLIVPREQIEKLERARKEIHAIIDTIGNEQEREFFRSMILGPTSTIWEVANTRYPTDATTPVSAPGYVSVPVEPTDSMVDAAIKTFQHAKHYLDDDGKTDWRAALRAALKVAPPPSSQLPPSLPEGYVPVPLEPTLEMMESFYRACEKAEFDPTRWESGFHAGFKAMLSARPLPAAPKQEQK
jgi:hypothetical protein